MITELFRKWLDQCHREKELRHSMMSLPGQSRGSCKPQQFQNIRWLSCSSSGKTAEIVLLNVDDCRKRWKNVRDTHRRERKKEKERCRSGAEASTSRPWRYSQIMAFLNPFMEDRATTSNFPASQGQGDAGNTGEDAATTSQASSEVEGEDMFTLFLEPMPQESEAPSQTFTALSTSILTPTFTSTPTPSTSRERSRPRGQKRPHEESLSPFERQLMGAVEKAVTQTAPPDPDRQFFEGLFPDLKALSARRRADVKFKIHKIIFDATCQEFAEKEQEQS
ncbi:uncharacterized protein LOC115589421 [Sparus aurata]|uniref:uncharacterized protein LOC115589421 n=1 Tax=Sparus aurata TaxID=8175 RepID=UPI0011C1006D|nr:uncharacterized protein LOC115589421 [Sparus aurata]